MHNFFEPQRYFYLGSSAMPQNMALYCVIKTGGSIPKNLIFKVDRAILFKINHNYFLA